MSMAWIRAQSGSSHWCTGTCETRSRTNRSVGDFRQSYLRTWHANQMTVESIVPVLDAFDRAGIRVMLLKGAALTERSYWDYGLRPMEDCDLMVPSEQVSQAVEMLRQLGWLASPHRAP